MPGLRIDDLLTRGPARFDVRSRAAALSWALLGGICLACGAPPLSSRVGPFVGLALLCVAALHHASKEPWFAGLVGLLFGTVTHAIGLVSLVQVFEQYGGLSFAAALVLAPLVWLLSALPYALACFVSALCMRQSRMAWAFLPCALTAACAFVPQIFPFQPGALAASWIWLAQTAELSGTSIVTLSVAGTAAACVTLFRQRALVRSRAESLASTATGPLLGFFVCFVLPQAYGALRVRQVRAERMGAPSLRVGVVQPNVTMDSLASEEGKEAALAQLREATRELATRHTDLTVWPESAYPFRLARTRTAQPRAQGRTIGDGESAVLFGTLSYLYAGSRELEYNSAWLAGTGDSLHGRVDKKHLLPFAEYIPLWHTLPIMRERYRSPGLTAGKSGLVQLEQHALGVLICYEDLLAGLAREHAQAGAQLLVNLTNDGWFGHSSVPALHDALARMRAIETRRDLVRATNTGVSSVTSATGEVLEQTAPFERTSFVAEVRTLRSLTLYTRVGDWVSPLCLLLCLGMALDARRFGS